MMVMMIMIGKIRMSKKIIMMTMAEKTCMLEKIMMTLMMSYYMDKRLQVV